MTTTYRRRLVARLLCTLLAVFGALGALAEANAVPFTLYYSVSPVGEKYQYDFTLVLDNKDGSWVAGEQYNWLVIGRTPFEAPLLFTEGSGCLRQSCAGHTRQILGWPR